MKFYMAAGLLAGTQADAKARDHNFVQHDVPTDKDGLMEYVNDLLMQIADLRLEKNVGSAMDNIIAKVEQPAPPPSPPAAPSEDHAAMRRRLAQDLRGMEVEAIEERILDMKGPAFGRTMAACVERLGSLGKDGWQAIRGHFDQFKMPTNYDRGLHILALCQIERMGEPKPAPQTYKEVQG